MLDRLVLSKVLLTAVTEEGQFETVTSYNERSVGHRYLGTSLFETFQNVQNLCKCGLDNMFIIMLLKN